MKMPVKIIINKNMNVPTEIFFHEILFSSFSSEIGDKSVSFRIFSVSSINLSKEEFFISFVESEIKILSFFVML